MKSLAEIRWAQYHKWIRCKPGYFRDYYVSKAYERLQEIGEMGILEEINEKLDRLLAGGGTGTTDKPATGGGKGKTKITLEELTALVQPIVQDDAKKAKLKAYFSSIGITRLGEAQPDQFPGIKTKIEELSAEEEEEDLV